MKKYNIFVNGSLQGSIKTSDIESHIEKNYNGVRHEINHHENEVFLYMDILEVMRKALGKDA